MSEREREVIVFWFEAIVVNNDNIPLSEIKPMAADYCVCICAYLKIHYELLSWQRPTLHFGECAFNFPTKNNNKIKVKHLRAKLKILKRISE